MWLVAHAKALCSEYTARYKKIHATEAIIDWFIANPPDLPDRGLTPFVIAIKDSKYHMPDPVSSYRAYYVGDKARFAKWSPKAVAPHWWPDQNA